MLGISFWEGLILAAVALIVLGPEKLPEAAQAAAKFYLKIKSFSQNQAAELKQQLSLNEIDTETGKLSTKLEAELKSMSIASTKLKNQLLDPKTAHSPNASELGPNTGKAAFKDEPAKHTRYVLIQTCELTQPKPPFVWSLAACASGPNSELLEASHE